MTPSQYRRVALAASFTERYILSLVFFYFIWVEAGEIQNDWSSIQAGDNTYFADAAKHLILALLDINIGLVLAFGRRAAASPHNLQEIFVPLADTFYFYLYNFTIPGIALSAYDNLAPQNLQMPLVYIGLVLGFIGPAIAVWGIIYLGRCFGIFVAVRGIVTSGPYRYIRHPLYSGYICMFVGMFLTGPCEVLLILVPIHFVLFYWRARLEEARLAEFSPEYREYRKSTGMFFPKLGRRAGT
jgi:protein-S-isoprenylcysteine O-methyltransferase Ste14